MASGLSLGGVAALFLAMALLAAAPSVSVLLVATRAATSGFRQGAYAAAGVVAGDIVFILLAVFGLVLIAEALGGAAFLLQYAGGLYLLVLAVHIWRARAQAPAAPGQETGSGVSSFMTGLLVTLGDQKAILFYLGFLPAFVDLQTLHFVDALAIIAVAVVAVGGVKLGYAWGLSGRGASCLCDSCAGSTPSLYWCCSPWVWPCWRAPRSLLSEPARPQSRTQARRAGVPRTSQTSAF